MTGAIRPDSGDAAEGRDASCSGAARQGHLYEYDCGGRVIALSSGSTPMVAHLGSGPWLGSPFQVPAYALRPLPMKYFRGEVPW
jgi:hypothetical protein